MIPASNPTPFWRAFLGPDGLLRPFWRAVLFVVLGVAAAFLLTGAVRGLVSGPVWLLLGISAALGLVLILLETWFLLSVLDYRSFRTVGLWFYAGWAREAAAGIAIGAGLIAMVVAGLVLAGAVSFAGFSATRSALQGVILVGVIMIPAAAFEEVFFRGYGFQRLVESVGAWPATLVFAAFFGVVHLTNPHPTLLSTLNTMLAGVLLAVAYLKTRALWLPLGLHWAWNFFLGPVFSLPVSGVTLWDPLFHVSMHGPEWLSGGNYGPEGSIVLTGVAGVASVLLWRARRICVSPAMRQALE
jgi:hypothetical protein